MRKLNGLLLVGLSMSCKDGYITKKLDKLFVFFGDNPMRFATERAKRHLGSSCPTFNFLLTRYLFRNLVQWRLFSLVVRRWYE